MLLFRWPRIYRPPRPFIQYYIRGRRLPPVTLSGLSTRYIMFKCNILISFGLSTSSVDHTTHPLLIAKAKTSTPASNATHTLATASTTSDKASSVPQTQVSSLQTSG